MKRPFLLIPLLLIIVSFFTLQANALFSDSVLLTSSGSINYNVVSQGGWLHTDGIYVKDSEDNIVAMRIIDNIPWHFGYMNKEALLPNAREHGVNIVQLSFRLPSTDGGLGFSFDYDTQIAELDEMVNLCEQNGLQLALCYHHATTTLRNDYGIDTVDKVIEHLNTLWQPIVNHYKNDPTVVGIRIIDEPNLSVVDEQKLWTETIGYLRQINPNLLWFAHTICEVRFGEQYWHLIPWKTHQDVPYPNIIMDGGIVMNEYNTEFGYNYALDDYDGADQLLADVEARMTHFRDNVQIPTGITPCISDYFNQETARTYFLREIHRWMEANRYILTLYSSEYQIGVNDGLDVLNKVFPDTPYPTYW